jgi:hypothetical protein
MPRTTMIARGIVLVAVVAAALSACTPPLPPDVLAAQAENTIKCQKGDQPVAVPEDFAGAMAPVSANLSGVCPDQSISEVAAGQTASLQIVDHAPNADEIAAFQKTCTGSVIVVPAFGYGLQHHRPRRPRALAPGHRGHPQRIDHVLGGSGDR